MLRLVPENGFSWEFARQHPDSCHLSWRDVLRVRAEPSKPGSVGRKGKWGAETHICESFEFESSTFYWARRVEEGQGSWFPLSLVA